MLSPTPKTAGGFRGPLGTDGAPVEVPAAAACGTGPSWPAAASRDAGPVRVSPPAIVQAVSASPAATTASIASALGRLLGPATRATRFLTWSSTSGKSTGAPPARDLRRREP